MSLTTDPNDPRLQQHSTAGQNEVYLVLSEEERAKGFVRPVREAYKHVGLRPKYPTRELTVEEKTQYAAYGYELYEEYPKHAGSSVVGRFWTRAQLNSGCQTVTTMSRELAETYAREPRFYGATYCCGCGRHFDVGEFVWLGTNEAVGS